MPPPLPSCYCLNNMIDSSRMNYYCIMVRTGGEEEFKADALEKMKVSNLEQASSAQFWFFRRKLRIGGKQNGHIIDPPLFPGYVFMGINGEVDSYLYEEIRKVKNFYHFLSSNANRVALYGRDLEIMHHLLRFGETSGFSKARFDENDRIVIVEGCAAGKMGQIIKVDRRKQRVTVRLDFCGSINTIDLGYELINKLPPRATKSHA